MSRLTIIADENIPNAKEYFSVLGDVQLVDGRGLSYQQIKFADILLVRSVTKVDRILLEGPTAEGSRVRFVATATIGVDHLDTTYLQAAGIGWANAPGCNADSVVDYMLSAFCRLDGLLANLLAGAEVGIIGMGNVGSRLYHRLSQLNISCRAYDPLIPQNRYPVMTDLDTVLAADVLCLHAPLTREGEHPTFHLLDEQRLSQLKPGTVLINAGRGAVVDNQALKTLLMDRADLCVVLDVWEGEPAIDIELLKRVDLGTPHIAGYSLDGKLRGTEMIFRACCDYLQRDCSLSELPAASCLTIDVDCGQSRLSSIKDSVLAMYDIGRDDQNLRGAMFHGLGLHGAGFHHDAEDEPHRLVDNKSTAFDQLRKNYPVRREFSGYSVVNPDTLSDDTLAALTALGLSC